MKGLSRAACGLFLALLLISVFDAAPIPVLRSPSVVEGAIDSGGSLVGYWKFDEGLGSSAYDSSGYGNHGTIYSGFNSTGGLWVGGVYNYSLQFDGVDDYVEVQDSLSLAVTDEITVMAWVKPAVNISDQKDLAKIVDRIPYSLQASPESGVGFSFYDSQGSLREV